METTISDAEQEQQQAQPPELPTSSAADRERFEVELEFVQCLASPEYLHCTSTCRHSSWLQCENMHQQYASYFASIHDLPAVPHILAAAAVCQVHPASIASCVLHAIAQGLCEPVHQHSN
eukprot:2239-Heterococcus_DN1.PRE.2